MSWCYMVGSDLNGNKEIGNSMGCFQFGSQQSVFGVCVAGLLEVELVG